MHVYTIFATYSLFYHLFPPTGATTPPWAEPVPPSHYLILQKRKEKKKN
jgi:hypothetical protein